MLSLKVACLVAALLMLPVVSFCQDPATELPSGLSRRSNPPAGEAPINTNKAAGPTRSAPLIRAQVAKTRVWSRELTLWVVAMNVATVADIESTQHAMKNHANVSETSFLYGPHPSRARMYGINAPMNFGVGLLAYWAKSKLCPGDDCWAWRLPTVSFTIGHAAAASANFARYR